MRFLRSGSVCVLFCLLAPGCVTVLTSIDREADGSFIITASHNGGFRGTAAGIIWRGKYDPSSETITLQKLVDPGATTSPGD